MKDIIADLVALRHDLHREPELGFAEVQTKARIAKILRDLETGNTYTGEKYNYLRAQQLVADERGIGLLPDEVPILPEVDVFLRGETRRAPAESGESSGDK